VPLAPSAPDTRFIVKRILPIDGPMRQGDHHWDETGAPAGRIVVTIDLAAQTLSVFRAGYEIGTAVIIYGAEEKPTPLGIFSITQKDARHVSNLYNAPMPHMLRLTNDGISIHGSNVGDGLVTHGCVGIPKAFARKLFDAVKLGDTVIVTRGEMLNLGDPITAA
jgi:lipoprotein-anchoring transpeptidase ErfK/SrfK